VTPPFCTGRSVRLVDDEVGVRHGAGAQHGRREGEQAQHDEDAADELDQAGPPARPLTDLEGALGAGIAAEETEDGGHAVKAEQ
jgi:hypothetical protein